ncbi:MAG: TolC family protein [Sulfuricurvum sp.]|uniref:TolC family protein n=1 Tax=Sulfuricurvum sp. TaxID=2025608 RepID=UPI00263098BF|nr:TolC family protein [Sulfuricurvum sp.]MDD5159062.1 TolC family protein [Sulfuricurvum sp.]
MKFFLLFVFTLSASAGVLTLDEAVLMALKSHPDVQSASLKVESANADTRSIQASLYPRIDLNADYFPTKTFVMPSNGTFSTRQNNAFHADVSASYTLWDFGRNVDRRQAAGYNEEESASDKVSLENSIIEQVWLRYTTVAYLERLIDTAQKSSQFYKEQYHQSVKMREAGLKTQADESRFKASWMEADEHLRATRAEVDKTLLALGLLVGSNQPITIDEEDFDRRVNAISYTADDLGLLRQELSKNNPKLIALKAIIDHSKALSDAASKEAYGTVSLVGSYGHDNSLSSYDSSQIGVKGTIPLYDGGKMSADAQKSRIAFTLAQKEYESAERALWQELYGAIIDLKRSDETIATKTGVIDATQRALSLMEGRYAQGLATYIDVLESQSVLESARIAHAEAKLQKIRAWAQIRRLLNKGCDNDICKN